MIKKKLALLNVCISGPSKRCQVNDNQNTNLTSEYFKTSFLVIVYKLHFSDVTISCSLN